jgi:protein phosphatase
MKVYEYSNKGGRDTNQDFVISKILPSAAIFIVADGMGGYSYGEIASRVVGESIVDFVQLNINNLSPSKLLKDALAFANECLMLKRLSLEVKYMGAVLSVLLVINHEAYMTWLGDSRIYIYRNGQEVYKTEDHSVVNELAKIKCLKTSDIDKYASVVTRSIMGDENLGEIEVSHLSAENRDIFIICTDGFYKEIGIDLILKYNDSSKDDLDKKSESISDNYSFIKVEI